MLLRWFHRLRRKTRAYVNHDDLRDRNAVIQRIVTAASNESTSGGPLLMASSSEPAPAVPLPTAKSTPKAIPPLPPLPPTSEDDTVSRAHVAARAYELWLKKGRPVGTAEHDWKQADAELRAERLYRPDGES